MRYAADLHVHSRHAAAVSKDMTLENMALWARRKGIDVISTGDCLQPDWLKELESKLVESEAGWFQLRPEIDAPIKKELPGHLQRPLRWVLGTEISCATPKNGKLNGLHHLVYFPSFERLKEFRRKVAPFGNLFEGRPQITLTSRQLLEEVLANGEDSYLIPAHLMNSYFSALGVIEDGFGLEQWFGELTDRLTAAETGLSSTPEMCRRLSLLDPQRLFSNSDAHSLENIGRECTLLETEPGYSFLFNALRGGGKGMVVETLKFPVILAPYYLNRCGPCNKFFEGKNCPKCQGRLVQGSRDRLEQIADRPQALYPEASPPFRQLLPLKHLIAECLEVSRAAKAVGPHYENLLATVGTERFILTEAREEVIAAESQPLIASAILAQRDGGYAPEKLKAVKPPALSQMELL